MTEETKKPKVSVLQNATNHYKRQISGAMKSFHVPEWDCEIYYRPVQTLRAEAEVVELTKSGKTVEALVMTIINKARDEEGNPLFTKHDKASFMNEIDPQVVLRVATQINGATPEDMPALEELEKN